MGFSAYAKLFYGAPFKPSDLVEEFEEEQPLCHPEAIRDGDRFCPECGEQVNRVEVVYRVRPDIRDILPDPGKHLQQEILDDRGLNYIAYEWLGDWGSDERWPATAISPVEVEVVNRQAFIGTVIAETDNIAERSSVVSIDQGEACFMGAPGEKLSDVHNMLLRLGYKRKDMKLRLLGVGYA